MLVTKLFSQSLNNFLIRFEKIKRKSLVKMYESSFDRGIVETADVRTEWPKNVIGDEEVGIRDGE